MIDILVFLVIIVPLAIGVGYIGAILFGGAVSGAKMSWMDLKVLFWEAIDIFRRKA